MLDLNSSRWYALRVRSRHEKVVFTHLMARQHDAFLPLYSTRHKWIDRSKTLSLPLFPGYVFCQFNPMSRSSVLATPGIIDVVRHGSVPAPVEATEIEAIQKVVSSQLMTEPHDNLVQGQRVRITGGPLSGLVGVLTENRKNLRFVLTIELLQRSVLVEIEREWIESCEPLITPLASISTSRLRQAL